MILHLLPMGTQFVQIPRKFLELYEGTKFIDVLVYAAIDFQKDSGTSKIGMRTISDKYNIALSKVEDSVKRLKDNGFLECEQHPSPNNPDYKYNEYTFPLNNEGFLMLKPSLLSLPLKPKDRGMLIYLQLIAIPDMNDIQETKIEDLAKRLKISRQTTSKYLKAFEKGKYISKERWGYKCQYLSKDIEQRIDKPIDLIILE